MIKAIIIRKGVVVSFAPVPVNAIENLVSNWHLDLLGELNPIEILPDGDCLFGGYRIAELKKIANPFIEVYAEARFGLN